MRFNLFKFKLKVNRAVTLNIDLFRIRLTNFAAFTNINGFRKKLIFLSINYWISMYRYEYLITLAMDSNAVIKILVFIVRGKLHIYVFTDA